MNESKIVQLKKVSFAYNHHEVLEKITLDVHRGEYLGLIGPNGSGKTTLLKLILGQLEPTKGTIKLFGKNTDNFKAWQKVGYVPQNTMGQIQHFPVSVEEVVKMGLTGKTNNSLGVDEALEAVGMKKHKKNLIAKLSGGQQQRVYIARALVKNPELLILDEPTSGVDVEAQNEFYALLRKLNTEMGLTLIMVSHDVDVVSKEVTTIACLNKQLVCHLPPKEFNKKEYLEDVYGKELSYISHKH